MAFRSDKSHRQQHEVGVELDPRLGIDLHGVKPRHVAVGGTGESFGRDRIVALAAFFVRGRHPEDIRPGRPRILRGAGVGRTLEHLQLPHAARALTMRGAETVGAGVAAADDDHVLVARADHLDLVALAGTVLKRQVLHREVNAGEFPPGHAKVARRRRSAGQDDGVEIAFQLLGILVDADVAAGPEGHAFLAHQRQPALQPALFQLEFRNAVAEEAADAIGALQHGDQVAGAVQLVGGCEARRSRADDRDPLSCS